jgi:hypothetical protein
MADEKKDASETAVAVSIEWYVPEGVMTPFATNMVIQTIENFFKISFFEIKPSIRLEESAPIPTKVRADCVASVIVTPDKLPKFIEVLQRQLEKYIAKQQAV